MSYKPIMLFTISKAKQVALDFVKDSASEVFTKSKFAGVYSGGATPDPISHSEVKSASGDGSARVTVWESSTMPAFFINPGWKQSGFFFDCLRVRAGCGRVARCQLFL